MENKDKEAFLKSIYGAQPIKKNNKINKKTHKTKPKTEITKHNHNIRLQKNKTETIKTKSNYILEKIKINKKIKKGKISIDQKIDFHGLSVIDAEKLFLESIINNYNKNNRCILFVTGKGVMKKNVNNEETIKLYYGKIREAFHDWIKKPEIQKCLLSVEQASINYGADGAFFVYLRKKN